MALSAAAAAAAAATSCPSLYRLHRNSLLTLPIIKTSVSFKSSPSYLNRGRCISIRASSVAAPPTSGGLAPAVSLSDNALNHLNKMKAERNEELCLRIGVKQGGCSGMSYTMEFESREAARPDDSIIEYNGFVIVCDPKSLLFLYGMQLDFSDALIEVQCYSNLGVVNPSMLRCKTIQIELDTK